MARANLSWRNDDALGSIDATPDHMLPVQFADLLQRSSERTPEQRLMAAVLEDAIRAFCQGAGAQGTRTLRLAREAGEWLESSDVSWPFAFENICDALALDPAWVRGLLGRWLAAHALSTQPAVKVRSIRRVAGTRHLVTGNVRALA